MNGFTDGLNWIGLIEITALIGAVICSARVSSEYHGDRAYQEAYSAAGRHLRLVVPEIEAEIAQEIRVELLAAQPYDWAREQSI